MKLKIISLSEGIYNLCKADYEVTVLADCNTGWNKNKINEMLKYYEGKDSKVTFLNEVLI
ncbi:MAG: hypothetical protein JW982_02185 [Spirochaetes bacterium]|nr:hypothetical protein [Spirochaetota bacterium]